ncbi:MAG: cysteine hydrolase [Bdellovibrionales bacterium]|nr:cysteine hydrolase [Bdellovibrionales bacterium]
MTTLSIPKMEAALLIVDMQNGFVHSESRMGQSFAGTEKQREIVPSILKLIDLFSSAVIPIIWSQQEHFSDDKTREKRVIRPHSIKQGFLPCVRGTWETEIFAPLKAAMKQEDHVVQKHRASVFYNTNLETKLRMLGTRFLFISGCNTEFCIESTVRDAYARDFEIIVVRDCVAGIMPEFHESSLAVIESYFGEVLTLEQIRGLIQ